MAKSRVCSIPDCGKRHYSRGFCRPHYYHFHRYGDPLGGSTSLGEPLNFLTATVLSYDGDKCLTWPYATDGSGYGQIKLNGQLVAVHRLICEIFYGPPPSSRHETAHSCGNGHLACVTKRHLRWATPKDNHADLVVHGTHIRGARAHGAKLTEDAVRQIRSLHKHVPRAALAKRFRVSLGTINNVLSRHTWAWLE